MAHYEVVLALIAAADQVGAPYYVGLTTSTQGSLGRRAGRLGAHGPETQTWLSGWLDGTCSIWRWKAAPYLRLEIWPGSGSERIWSAQPIPIGLGGNGSATLRDLPPNVLDWRRSGCWPVWMPGRPSIRSRILCRNCHPCRRANRNVSLSNSDALLCAFHASD